MAHKHIITLFLAALVLPVLSGCQESSRIDRVRPRWQRKLDQARLEAAEESLKAGKSAYAERLLSDCRHQTDAASPVADQIQQLRTRIQDEHHCYAATEQGVADTAY